MIVRFEDGVIALNPVDMKDYYFDRIDAVNEYNQILINKMEQ